MLQTTASRSPFFTASRNAKRTLVRDYLASAPDPERGYALAALTGELTFHAAKPAMIRKAVEARIDPILFRWSYDYVGDLAETVALIWPARHGQLRSFVRIFHALSWAFARSPGARSLACARLASFCDPGLFFPRYGVFACAAP